MVECKKKFSVTGMALADEQISLLLFIYTALLILRTSVGLYEP